MEQPPKFETYEELQEWLEAQENQDTSSNSNEESGPSKPSKKSTKKKSTSKKNSRSKKKPPKDEGIALLESKVDASVWSSVHFYTQPGDNIASVRIDAKEEIGRRNENVRAFFHDHLFGEACNTKCGEAIV